MIEAILVSMFPLVAHGRTQLVSVSGHSEHDRLLHTKDNQRNVVVGFTFDVLPFLMRCDG